MRLWKSSIFWRIYLINLAIIGVLLASMLVTSAITLPELSRDKSQKMTEASVSRLKEEVENVLAYVHNLTDYVTNKKDFHSSDPAALKTALDEIIEASGIFDSATVTDASGKVVAVSPVDLSYLLHTDLSSREYFKEAVRQKEPYISDVTWADTKRPIVVVGVPILSPSGEVERTVNLTLRISENKLLSTMFREIELGAGGYAFLFDRNGRLLSHPDKSRIGEDYSTNPLVEAVRSKVADTMQVTDADGRKMDATYTFVSEVEWGIVALVPDESIYESYLSFRQSLLLISGILLPPFIWLMAVFSKQIIKPIRKLYDAVDQVAKGNYETDLPHVSPNSEIGLLTNRFNDMLHTIRDAREQIKYQALHDPLTGLPNRILATDRIDQMLTHAERAGTKVAVAFLNLDRFKGINDSLGHSAGDLLLREVSDRIFGCLADGDTLSRIGGDEFLVAIPDVGNVKEVLSVMQDVLDVLNVPFYLDGHELFLTASIGISFFPHDGEEVEELIKNADIAMHRAKEQGRNMCQLHTPAMNQDAAERLLLENNLRKALERREFCVYYQPKIDLKTGTWVGMEALVRWNHSQWGLVSPAKFIPVAEETGLIGPIGEWVLRTACLATKRWHEAGHAQLRVAVNLSGHQVHQPNLVETVQDILTETGLPPQFLELELTESILMQNTEVVIETLHRLRSMGIAISIDDFGTGYSSLAYLTRFPISGLKIDQSFVRRIDGHGDRIDGIIAKAVISLAHNLDLEVVAEGVETATQFEFLREEHCNLAQGYLFSRPIPAEDFEKLLTEAESASYTESV